MDKITTIMGGFAACPACVQLRPILEGVMADYSFITNYQYLDVTAPENALFAGQYGAQGYPVIVFIDVKGRELEVIRGTWTRTTLINKIEANFNKAKELAAAENSPKKTNWLPLALAAAAGFIIYNKNK